MFSQLDFGSDAVKPTRFLMRRQLPLHPAMRPGPPRFSPTWDYLGPLEHRRGQPLIGKAHGVFKTNATAAWPGPLCQWVAPDIVTTYLRHRGYAREGGRSDS